MNDEKRDTRTLPLQRRDLSTAEIVLRRESAGVRLSFPASSEAPVDRWLGREILSHDPSAIRLERANAGAIPVLFNHDWDVPIGMVESMRAADGRLQVDARLFATERAREVESMIRGGLRNVSVGYRVHQMEEPRADGSYVVRDWEPYEVSIVSVPADPSVGIGRSQQGEDFEVRIVRAQQPAGSATTKEGKMPEVLTAPAGESADNHTPNVTVGPNAVELEQARRRGIETLCKANKIDDNVRDYWIGQGIGLDRVADDLLKIMEERSASNPQPATRLGLTPRETRQFSLIKAIRAVVDKNWTNAGFELECSRAIADKLGRVPDPHKFYVPFEIQERPIDKRDLTVGTAGAGGYLVGTNNVGFIEMLRNRSVAFRMGARRLSGMTGNVTIPRQSAAATGYWLANEATAITESQQTFVQLALTPKTVGAYTEVSRQLLLQSSPDAEGIVMDDLAQVVALAADLAVLEGSGASGQPTGISNTAGIGSVSGTSLAAAGILEFQSDVASANVTPVRPGYVTTPAVAALLMVRPELPSTGTTRLWTGNLWDGRLFDLPAMSTNQVSASTMIFGDWQEVVVAEWGVLEVEVNPYANFAAGIYGVRAMYTMDVGIRRPFAFSRATSIT